MSIECVLVLLTKKDQKLVQQIIDRIPKVTTGAEALLWALRNVSIVSEPPPSGGGGHDVDVPRSFFDQKGIEPRYTIYEPAVRIPFVVFGKAGIGSSVICDMRDLKKLGASEKTILMLADRSDDSKSESSKNPVAVR